MVFHNPPPVSQVPVSPQGGPAVASPITESILGSVTAGKSQDGQRIIIAAQEKVGKTTTACGAPGALLIPCEQGYASMTVPRTRQITTWPEVIHLCEEIRTAAIRGQIKAGSSLVWDSGTALERFIHHEVVTTDKDWSPAKARYCTMETAHGGYGKAYLKANELFSEWTGRMDELSRNAGINIVVTCHVFASRQIDPTSGEFDQWDLLLHSPKNAKTYGKRELATQWADLVGFLYEPFMVVKAGEGERMNRGISSNQGRLMAVDRSPAYVAGNRYGLTQPIHIPFDNGWNYLADAIFHQTGGNIDLYNRG